MTRVTHTRHLPDPPDTVLEVVRALFPGGAAAGSTYSWTETSSLGSDAVMERAVEVSADTSGTTLTLSCVYGRTIPYFEWAFAGPVRRTTRSRLAHDAERIAASLQGREPPAEPKRPWWSPPEAMDADQIRVIATLSLILAVVEYGGSLLTQTVDYVARSYGASNADLGVITALTRVGTIVALIGGALADRMGRRRLLLASVALVSVATVLSAAAPTLATFAAFQVLVRGGMNLAFAVAFIAAVEEAPEASRTYTIAIVGIASGLGFVLGALLLPLADLGPEAWRGLYAIGAAGLAFLPSASRNLTETRRFAALVLRGAKRGQIREVIDRRYGGRFALMCVTGFALNLFFAPESQFLNRYLADERGFSGLGILGLRAVTQALPALALAYIGGRLAESSGRRPIAVWGLVVGAAFTAAVYSSGGVLLWFSLAIATGALSAAGPALSAFGTELFPTEVRGTAGAGLTLTGVLGSAGGLLLVGYLAEPMGSIGAAIAVTAIGPVLVALLLIPRLPEARGMLLDDVSPSEV